MYNRPVVCLGKPLDLDLHVFIVSQSFVGGIRASQGVSLVCINVTIIPKNSRSFSAFQVEDVCCVGGHFFICIHRPTNSLTACTHMHIQKSITDLRNVLQEREDWVWSQCGKLLVEVHEGEEEEQVRLRACVLYPQFQAILMQIIHV